MRLPYLAGLGLGLFSLTACATVDQGQRTVGEKTTDLASTAAMFEEESEKAAEYLQRSGARIRDENLETYVQSLANKSAGDFEGELDVYLLRAPVFNAFMMPNGTMGVNSGLLLRAETEDELMLILGHEFGHYYENHSLERHAAATNTNLALTALSLASAGVFAATGTYVNTSLASTAMVAGYFSFNRSHESEADRIGLQRAEETGYNTASAIRLWENLENEKAASSIRAVRKRHSSLYDTHPTNEARLAALKSAANVVGEIPRGSVSERRQYRATIRPHLETWLNDEIELRDAGATLNLLDRLDDLEEDKGLLLYVRARVIDRALANKKLKKDKVTRKLMIDQSPASVIALLKDASSYNDAPSVTFRDLGDRLYKNGQYKDATSAFERYLSLTPDAEDAQLINSLIVQMKSQT